MTLCDDKFNVSPGIQAFAGQVEGGAHTGSLDLLRAIDRVVDALFEQQSKLRPDLEMAHWLLDMLEKAECNGKALDPDYELDNLLDKAEGALKAYINNLRIRKNSAEEDGRLTGHHEDAVISAYEDTIELVSDLFEATEEIRVYIRELDADVSSTADGTYTTAQALIEALDAED